MNTYSLTTDIEVSVSDDDVAYPVIEITYRYSPGRRAYTPRGEYGPIDPPEPAEVEYVSAELIEGNGLTPLPGQVEQWGQDYIASDDGYHHACREAA